MSRQSAQGLLTLHAVRLLGFADTDAVAARFDLDRQQVAVELERAAFGGLVQETAFADLWGWSLTPAGRAAGESQLAAELDSGTRDRICDLYQEFLPFNAMLKAACTRWQLRPTDHDRLAANDHSDPQWDRRVLDDLDVVAQKLDALGPALASELSRFGGYDIRFRSALQRVRDGQRGWVDATTVDSCHTVWFQLHEDFVATLGVDRSAE